MITVSHYLILSSLLFILSVAGIFLNRKNVILLLMCIELMLLAVNFNFIALSRFLGDAGRPGVRVLYPDGGSGGIRDRAGHPGGAVPQPQEHRCREPRQHEGMSMESLYLSIVLAPLLAAVIAGLFGRLVGRAGAHTVTILGVAVSFGLSAYVLMGLLDGSIEAFNDTVYVWGVSDGVRMEVGFLVDRLSALMMTVVTFVSLMVHIYTIGYMHDDPGYQRFFATSRCSRSPC